MTRPGGSARPPRTRARARFRFGALAGLVALLAGFLVTVAPAAHALQPCADPMSCPLAFDDGTNALGGQFYKTPFDVKLTVVANPLDPAHDMGLMANDQGPAGTKIELGGFSDTQSWNGATITYTNNLNGSFTYTPDPHNPYSGIDQFDYSIVDPATGNDDFATAYIDVVASANDDSYGTKVNTPLTVNMPGLVANDLGVDPDQITLDTTSLHGGTIADNIDGAFVYTPPAGFQGVDTFGYTITDIDWDYTYAATVTIYVDGTPPLISLSAPGPVTMGLKSTATWSGSDPGGTGVASYDVQYDTAPWNGPYSAWAWAKMATTLTTSSLATGYGRTVCFRVRATDRAGNQSVWAQRCTSIPVRARSMTYSRLWTRATNAAYFSGEAFATKYNGQNATLAGLQAQHMWLIATKCASCGSLQVRWNNVVIGNVSLVSPTTVHHVLIPIAAWTAPKAGTLRVYVTSPSGRSVIVEGLAALRA
jgi:hypothetical protein